MSELYAVAVLNNPVMSLTLETFHDKGWSKEIDPKEHSIHILHR